MAVTRARGETMTRAVVNHELETLLAESGLAHAALARQVVHLGRTEYGLRLAYDYRSVGRWLAGAVPDPPTPALLAAVLSRLLGRGVTVHQLGFGCVETTRRSLIISASPAATVEAATDLWRACVERRKFLHNSVFLTAAALEAALDWRDNPARASIGRESGRKTVTDADVDRIRQSRDEFRHMDHLHGGGYALTWLQQFLDAEVTPLVSGRYTDRVGRDLFMVAATLTDMAGWMAMDTGQQGIAQRYYTQAAALAKHAGDSAYGAYVLGNLATQSLFIGQTRTAVRVARSALHAGGGAITPTLTARITVTEARAHALIGDAHETRQALRAAEKAMKRSDPSADPEWLGVFTPAHYAGSVMHALRDLGDLSEAAKYADDALDLPSTRARTRALHTVLQATVLAGRGDLDGAVEAARPVQRTAAALKSQRLTRRLDEFAQRLAAHQGATVVAAYLDADRDR